MSHRLRSPAAASTRILEAFEAYQARFREITRRSGQRFESRDWNGIQDDARERLLLYGCRLDRIVNELNDELGDRSHDLSLWRNIRTAYHRYASAREDAEIALTFFNSVCRRILGTVGVRPDVEFLGTDFARSGEDQAGSLYRSYPARRPTPAVLRRLLADLPFRTPFEALDRDALLIGQELEAQLKLREGTDAIEGFELLPTPFYRNKGAYVVGRICTPSGHIPLVLPLLNSEKGLVVDAVLTTSEEASVVFGFSRSYFHVEVDRPRDVVDFLRSILPLKRLDELYTCIGYHRHGKTELYRAIQEHLDASDATFQIALGERGTVMSVFTLPTLNVVFKVIHDRFARPKRLTRRTVRDKYRLVFLWDRVGRLADAQEFEQLEFQRKRFSQPLLEELLSAAPRTVIDEGQRLVIRHLYTERRMIPLNVYLGRADDEEARNALIDFGFAIKDLAAANIFPGDLLFKNFGVTRHGRVVFYDYDELIPLDQCNFRSLPQPLYAEQELASEPWFYVAENDVFPEEFARFLPIPDTHREPFMARHADLFLPSFWREMQERQEAREVVDFIPYKQSHRLQAAASEAAPQEEALP